MDWKLPSLPGLGQDTLPSDDAAVQLELKRRMRLAQQLQDQEAPQGQMVSGHYVAPSWTQYLANLAGKYMGGQQEKDIIKQYGEYNKSQAEKLGNVLSDIYKGKPTTSEGSYQIQVPNGQTPTPADKLGGMQPYETGMKNINVPMTTTSYTPYSAQEKLQMIGQARPDFANKIAEAQIADLFKTKKSTWMNNGNVQIQLDENGDPTGVTLPLGVSPDAAMRHMWEQYKFMNPSATDIMHHEDTVAGHNVTKRGQDLAHKDDEKKLNPLGLPSLTGGTTKPLTNSKGWTLHTDAKGNQAYVSPDGKQFEEAK